MALEAWTIGLIANGTISLGYLTIAALILGGLARSRDLLRNPLALATGTIFLSCGVGHGVQAVHLLWPSFVAGDPVGMAARIESSEWHMWAADAATAAVAVWYITLRGRFPALVRGTSMFEDLRARQREALQIHDNVVQGLAKAKLNFEVDRPEEGLRDIEETLAASRRIITNLLGDTRNELGLQPGQLRRESPAGRARPER